jgi:aminoglycoside phosphotransferase (APT) family kinase protein
MYPLPMTIDRARITAGELVVVLSHYDLGVIDSVRRFRGGSRFTPKVLVIASGGAFLLKRRPVPEGDVSRVRFAHQLHVHLASRGFPVPELVRSRSGASLLPTGASPAAGQRGVASGAYELHRFIEGSPYSRARADAAAAGQLLAEFHAISREVDASRAPTLGTFHRRENFAATMTRVRDRFEDPRAHGLCKSLLATYRHAAECADTLGAGASPRGIIHADWHPGNLIFASPPSSHHASSERRIRAVVDFDAVRTGPYITDLANGALQFAVTRRTDIRPAASEPPNDPYQPPSNPDTSAWRIAIDPGLVREFFLGYEQSAREQGGLDLRASAIAQALPYLMAEALIVEAALPIANTGRFGRLDPLSFLAVVDLAATGLCTEARRLSDILSA